MRMKISAIAQNQDHLAESPDYNRKHDTHENAAHTRARMHTYMMEETKNARKGKIGKLETRDVHRNVSSEQLIRYTALPCPLYIYG